MICGPCDRQRPSRSVPGEWRWWTHDGRFFNDLCADCFAWWLLFAAEDDALVFARLEPLTLVGA